jgi:hypothetical protein
VTRFAESDGYEADGNRPHAWRYRDFVVKSFNADKPFDRFVTEQLAGDLLAARREPRDAADLLAAAGYLRLGPIHKVGGNADPAEMRQEVLTEMVNNVGAAFLGTTLACCRCHDHKFDPVSLGDYYRVQAFFTGTQLRDLSLLTPDSEATFRDESAKLQAAIAPLSTAISKLESPVRAQVVAGRVAKLDAATRAAMAVENKDRSKEEERLVKAAGPTLTVRWDEILAAMSPADRSKRAELVAKRVALREAFDNRHLNEVAWTVRQDKSPQPTHVLLRGSHKQPSTVVTPAVPRVTVSTPAPLQTRLDLARELTRPDHPLTARVIVNRLWQQHYGRGIVATPNDFGRRGTPPTHPELLDWLAHELVEPSDGGVPWSLKRVHRLMVTSAAYRQSSDPRPELTAADPANKLLGRTNRRRLDAEQLRDAVLTAAGTLNRQVGGPSVRVPLEPEVYDLIFSEDEPVGLWPVTPDVKQHDRRSLYLHRKRNVRLPLLEAFDAPDTLNSCAGRGESTYAPQALILMNGPFTAEQSKQMAADVAKFATTSEARIDAVFRRAYGRRPRQEEVAVGREFLRTDSLADFCKAVLNTNEFVKVR